MDGGRVQAVERVDEKSRGPHRVWMAVIVVAVAALVTAGVGWWAGTGGHVRFIGPNATMPALAVGRPYFIGYEIVPDGGDVQIESVRLVDPPSGLDASYDLAIGVCSVGTSSSVPDSCNLTEPKGTTVHSGEEAWLVGRYTLTAPGTYAARSVVVTYRAGLHHRTQRVDAGACLTTEPTDASCTLRLDP